jgi:hypothetical protein
MPRYLTKSRFKEALECTTKLYYTGKKEEYADTNLTDPFLEALAKGGFQVGELAKYYFTNDPVADDITIKTLDYEEALAETQRRLAMPGRVVIAEAAFKFNNLFIRADIVVKEDDTIYLYEVKAKSADESPDENDESAAFINKKSKTLVSKWAPYLYDVAFQKYVMTNCDFSSHYNIKAHLMLADKNAATNIDGLNQLFKIIKNNNRNLVKVKEGLTRSQVGNEVIKKINIDTLIERIWNEFPVPNDWNPAANFEEFVRHAADLYERDVRLFEPIGSKCKKCRYIAQDASRNLKSGFHECWKQHTNYTDELLKKLLVTELWGGNGGGVSYTQKLIGEKVYLLENVVEDHIKPAEKKKKEEKLEPGLSALQRKMIQVEKVKTNDTKSYFDAIGMKAEMDKWTYPLHMIDFETSMVALPFHKGLKPYQGIAFQFSHHVMHKDGNVEHKGQFLATEPGVYPNYDFIRVLKKELENDNGTIFRYHNHENNYLNMIAEQLENNPDAPADAGELIAFIRKITRKKVNGIYEYGERCMVDLYELVVKYYYSPYAKGSNSLKQILPAIIKDSDYLREKYGIKGIYGKQLAVKSLNFDDHVWIQADKNLDPYKTLPRVFDDVDPDTLDQLVKDFDEVGDGGAALTAYNYLQFVEVPEEQRRRIADALLRYCELDTLAMVMIVEGWREMIQ